VNKELDGDALAGKWANLLKSANAASRRRGATIRPIRNITEMIEYAAKLESKTPPEGFAEVGRYWSTFGSIEYRPVEVVEGPAPLVHGLVRVLRTVEAGIRRQLGWQRPRDNGVCSRTIRNIDPARLLSATRQFVSRSLADSKHAAFQSVGDDLSAANQLWPLPATNAAHQLPHEIYWRNTQRGDDPYQLNNVHTTRTRLNLGYIGDAPRKPP